MTQPDGYDPGNFAPLSVTSQKTQEDWENEIRADLAPAFTPLEVAASWIINSIQGLIDTIIEALTSLPVVGGTLGDVFDALDGLWNTAQSALDGVGQLAWNLLNDPVGTIGQIPMMLVDGLESTIDGILDALQQVPVIGDLFAILRSAGARLLGLVPVGLVADVQPNILLEGGYDTEETIHPESDFEWVEAGVPGTSPLGSAWVGADGLDHSDATEVMPVGADWVLEIGSAVKWMGLSATSGAHAIRLNVLPYVDETTPHPGGPVMVASVESPSGDSSSDTDGWVEIVGTWSPPEGVTHFAVEKHVTSAASSGAVGFDETYVKATQRLPQRYTHNLPEDLSSLFNWIGLAVDTLLDALGETPVGPILDRIYDLGAALEGVAQDAWDAATDVAQLMTNLLTNPAAVIGTIPQSLVSGLETTLNQIGDIFNGLVVTPVNSVVGAIKDWFHSWFGGGSNQAIPASQKGAALGVAPLGPTATVPWEYLPDELTPVDQQHPHVLLTLPGDVTIPNAVETSVGGWHQSGSVAAVLDGDRFALPQAGWWQVQAQAVWEASGAGVRQAALTREVASSEVLVEVDGAAASAFPAFGGPRCKVVGLQDVSDNAPLSAADLFGLKVYQNSGGPLDLVSGYPGGTYVLATFIGERQESIGVGQVEFDQIGLGFRVGSNQGSWEHTAEGVGRAVVVWTYTGVTALYGTGVPTVGVVYGSTPMSALGHVMVDYGSAVGRAYLHAFILLNPPLGQRTITATVAADQYLVWFGGNSTSYTGVSAHSGLLTTSGTGTGMSQQVASSAGAMVSQAFMHRRDPISDYSQAFRYGITGTADGAMLGAMVAGDAPGSPEVNFTAAVGTSGPWASAAIELTP